MANIKKIDFEKEKDKGTILKGLVKSCDKIKLPDGRVEKQLNVICAGQTVIITEDNVINFPYAKTVISLVGEEVSFVVKDVFPDGIIYGDMKQAYLIKRKPIIDKLLNGEVLEGIVVHTVPHGAYISVGGVQGMLKNHDFSNDGTAVKDVYPKGSSIKVKFSRYTEAGKMLFVPEQRIEKTPEIDISKITVGQTYMGKITGLYPDRMYVNIVAGVECLCYAPFDFIDPKVGDNVSVYIKKMAFGKKDGKLLIRGKVTNRIYGDIL